MSTAAYLSDWYDIVRRRIHMRVHVGYCVVSCSTAVQWRNLCADDRIALSATDPANLERYLEVRGRLVGWEHDGALDLLDAMAKKYRDQAEFPRENAAPLDKRCTAVVEPLHCTTMG